MRIGLYGGTFNPIHNGHIRAAMEVLNGFKLEKLVFIPSAQPPHKTLKGIASVTDRIDMTRLAIRDYPQFSLSEVEVTRTGPSYTIDTVIHFKKKYPQEAALYLIMGIDAFLEIDTWKSYKELVKLIPIVVMTRPPSNGETKSDKHQDMTVFIEKTISGSYQFHQKTNRYLDDHLYPIYRFSTSMFDISSTQIRHLVQKGNSIRSLVPQPVEEFIYERGLYL